jgi:predicted nucleic-acid-binding protein
MADKMSMISVDTNVLARYFLKDDLHQWEIADRLMKSSIVYVSIGVILELIWLLEKRYHVPSQVVRDAVQGLLDSESVEVEHSYRVALALNFQACGVDFTDALHLASSQECSALATFDQAFIKAAATAQTSIPVNYP